ncbi:DUF3566 domain-containing protein [Planomonospora sp. ID91781]|uniref:DUF3566 domain-containing protein n=1 Tax=Planomonospora sp. ID91781 TaxID=2738135 RepID=UPI0027DC53AB|nr:DUF3566 domain-containing protein [Planomonospora sp. ID91781]
MTEKMDKATEADVVEVVESPADGGASAPETDGSATDETTKGGSGMKKANDDEKPADSTVRIRPASAEAGPSWSPGAQSAPPRTPAAPVSNGPAAGGSSPAGTVPGPSTVPGPGAAPRPGGASSSLNTATAVDGKAPGSSSPLRMDNRKSSDSSGPRTPRKAHLVLRRIEPWSAMKFSFVVSLVCFVVLFVAVAVLYMVLNALGVFDSIIQIVNQFTVPDGKASDTSFDISPWFEPVRILGYTALIGAVNVVLITALSTLGAVIYNVASDLVGGVEVTFSEAE